GDRCRAGRRRDVGDAMAPIPKWYGGHRVPRGEGDSCEPGRGRRSGLLVQWNVGALFELPDRLGVRVNVAAHATDRSIGVAVSDRSGDRTMRLHGDLADLLVDEALVLG